MPQQELEFPLRDDDRDSELRSALAAIDPDGMTPREALDALYRLKKQMTET